MKYIARVYHSYYGCDTGCCGHIFELTDENGKRQSEFDFNHPCGEEKIEWAKKEMLEKFPRCFDSIDWKSFECEAEDF